jgi:putative nucleotidyltransferase with HDIG domain
MVQPPKVTRAELLGVISFVGDLGMGQPMEHALRQCRIAVRLADALGLDDRDRDAAWSAGVFAWVGCHVDAYEQAKWFGDDTVLKADFRTVDFRSPAVDAAFMLSRLGSGRGPLDRARATAGFFSGGVHDARSMLANHWAAADELATGLGIDATSRRAIEQTFERWDGRGIPHGAKGDEIVVSAQLVNLADVVEIFHRLGGVPAAVEVARSRRGTQFSPTAVDLFCDVAGDVLGDLDDEDGWTVIRSAGGSVGRPLDEAELDRSLEAVADFVDVKSPYTLGHSRAVADLAAAAADDLGLARSDAVLVRRAGLLHDLGRLGVPNTIWDKPGPLTAGEEERMRLHPYLTQRAVERAPGLASCGAVAAQHHERVDGSGYPRGARRSDLAPTALVLAAADCYRTRLEPRPHREAQSVTSAAAHLRHEVVAGRLDADAVEAVLGAAGHRRRRRPEGAAGLTPRELEVLRLLARGASTRVIGRRLHISPKTAANHIEHIYAKLGVGNRALASLRAERLGLVGSDDVDAVEEGGAG